MTDSSPIRTTVECNGSLLRVVLDRPAGNILDRAMVAAIRAAVSRVEPDRKLRTVLFEGDGRHFSYGSSVKQHRAGEVEQMLPEFHHLFRELLRSGKILLAAVRGRCLGGGLELAAFCHRVFASPDAELGNPEIKLGVFAPVASIVLPLRCGQPVADELLLTGRTMDAAEALQKALVDEIAGDPAQAAMQWHTEHVVPLSGAALHHAARAARHRLGRELEHGLDALERAYLDELMSTEDAREGITAFLEKRKAAWKHR